MLPSSHANSSHSIAPESVDLLSDVEAENQAGEGVSPPFDESRTETNVPASRPSSDTAHSEESFESYRGSTASHTDDQGSEKQEEENLSTSSLQSKPELIGKNGQEGVSEADPLCEQQMADEFHVREHPSRLQAGQ